MFFSSSHRSPRRVAKYPPVHYLELRRGREGLCRGWRELGSQSVWSQVPPKKNQNLGNCSTESAHEKPLILPEAQLLMVCGASYRELYRSFHPTDDGTVCMRPKSSDSTCSGVLRYVQEGGPVAAMFARFCSQDLCAENRDFIVAAYAYEVCVHIAQLTAVFLKIWVCLNYLKPDITPDVVSNAKPPPL